MFKRGVRDRTIFHELITPEEALRRIFSIVEVKPVGVEEVDIFESYNRVLAEDVYAPIDVPPFDRASMDGYAVLAEDTYGANELNPIKLRLKGFQPIDSDKVLTVESGEAVEVATGSPLPIGANAVIPVEYTKVEGDRIVVFKTASPGENIVYTGSDIAMGELVLRRGTIIREREVALLAALGLKKIRVFKRPRVAIISTGDELEEPGKSLRIGKIYDVNTHMLSHAVRSVGCEPIPLGIVRDDVEEIEKAVRKAIEIADVVILSGGTSAGPEDVVYKALGEFGPPGVIVHGLKVKPGKPTVIAISREGKLLFGLPGYPNSALMIFDLIVRPILARMSGYAEYGFRVKARLGLRVYGEKGRMALYPVCIVEREGGLVAYPLPTGPGHISPLAYADGFIAVPENVEFFEEGELVEVRVFTPFYQPANLYVIGSHDIGLDLLITMLPNYVRAKTINVGSMGGVRAIIRGDADIAGVHLIDEQTGVYNIPILERLGVKNAVLIRGYYREQGLIVARGNPKGIKGVEDLLREDVRIVNRNKGAGTRVLLDLRLKEIAKRKGVSFEELTRRIRGYTYEVKTHTAVAAAVAQGKADVGIGIRAAAEMYNLDFIPLGWEEYDFLIRIDRLSERPVKAFLDVLRSEEFRRRLESLPGYKVPGDIGEVIWRGS